MAGRMGCRGQSGISEMGTLGVVEFPEMAEFKL